MSDKRHDSKNRLSHTLTLAVTSAEIEKINSKRNELGMTPADFLRASIECLAGEKIFRERIHEK